ncbi:nuclear pore complex protein [Grosmannia clavigera kw1407]|uniref:Nuclear pore complex protein n=1 Tax=Grosmannia clavigera (strain kw1407 / UAMH 11150) TaxID=655863 RepID=F0XG75_GROCL|nr:nuclear pore complex protein [Grosmannia clavigera kw1407]EFX02657.1 nuclear pore complex protein [Grosmannia clavigera kw1407]
MASRSMHTPPRQTLAGLAAARGRASSARRATAADSPGNWRHPRMDEITRRRSANVFTESNLKTAIYNGLALGVVYVARTANGTVYQQICRFLVPVRYAPTLWLLVQLALVLNIARAIMPLFRQPDTMADIPLTPGQRKLLGLVPVRMSASVTPGGVAAFTTPPRYARTPSMSSSPAAAASGLTAASNMATGSRSSYASYTSSPISSSPLFNKTRAVSGTSSSFSTAASPFPKGRRSSFGSFGSPGAVSSGAGPASAPSPSLFSESTLSVFPGTPSPSSGKRLSMGLNNKWLYEKGRRGSGSAARIY